MNPAKTTCANGHEAIVPVAVSARHPLPGMVGGGFATPTVTPTRARNGDVKYAKSRFRPKKGSAPLAP